MTSCCFKVNRLSVIFFLTIWLLGCSTSSTGLDGAEALLQAKPSANVALGTAVTIDASQSIFDKISWFMNDEPVTKCQGQSACVFAMEIPGSYTVSIVVLVEATDFKSKTKDTASLVINVGCGELGRELANGILVRETEEDCIIMDRKDRAECRSSNYAACADWFLAASLCEQGLIPGTAWYLPQIEELTWVYSMREVPENFCDASSTACASSSMNGLHYTPNTYWSSSLATSTPTAYWFHDFSSNTSNMAIPLNSYRSVRCVKRIPMEQLSAE